jgi:hypothetical protein
MKNILLFIILPFSLLLFCCNPEEQIRRQDIISEEDFVQLLVEIHLSEGLLIMPNISKKYPGRDSISNYIDVIRKHGFEKEDFDRTIRFYSSKPHKLDNIYELVINELNKIEGEIIRSAMYSRNASGIKSNLWNRKRIWHLPEDGEREQINFNIPVYVLGTYSVIARIRMYEDDESLDPSVFAYYWYDDGSKNGYSDPFPERRIEKNGKESIYIISKDITNPKVTHIKGSILYHKRKRGRWLKHVDVTDINVEYNPE